MYINKVHTLIEQGLQTIGVFAYGDFLQEEVDLAINAAMFKMMDEQLEPVKNAKGQRERTRNLQYVVDQFQNLQVKEAAFTPTLNPVLPTDYFIPLPVDYMHLIADVSLVLSKCNSTPVATGNILVGSYYLVTGTKTVIYNGQNYATGSIFQGVTGITGYSYTGTGTLIVINLRARKKPNRLTIEEVLYNALNNALEKTDTESPVSSISANQLFVYVDGFWIWTIFLTYLRKPKVANSQFVTYSVSTDLVIGNQYESVDNPITYNSMVYQPFVPFTIVTGFLRYTGTATVRGYQDGDVEFTDSMSYNLVDRVVETLAIKSEQSQQKIVNLEQENI